MLIGKLHLSNTWGVGARDRVQDGADFCRPLGWCGGIWPNSHAVYTVIFSQVKCSISIHCIVLGTSDLSVAAMLASPPSCSCSEDGGVPDEEEEARQILMKACLFVEERWTDRRIYRLLQGEDLTEHRMQVSLTHARWPVILTSCLPGTSEESCIIARVSEEADAGESASTLCNVAKTTARTCVQSPPSAIPEWSCVCIKMCERGPFHCGIDMWGDMFIFTIPRAHDGGVIFFSRTRAYKFR